MTMLLVFLLMLLLSPIGNKPLRTGGMCIHAYDAVCIASNLITLWHSVLSHPTSASRQAGAGGVVYETIDVQIDINCKTITGWDGLTKAQRTLCILVLRITTERSRLLIVTSLPYRVMEWQGSKIHRKVMIMIMMMMRRQN
ncbi:hypothetical protein M441DRAFT_42846 [Trichoderma asperellum CBS 433.97]|uniref:Secreted protein n=1 Tax=Trichoderma asperellum (strain ATCC 204424 / CBS 433.97 / NBRC 101777) TaxID=1042311 RepID=A0A2T3ZQR2_TRIA4|nr:hypothetical protein M441DRAFT_42846 [Trichoderma asperellum CBS 433.97]PTB47135.1 hypothetical protein M441DRAFT_42846 [Trichoderma asperellum CBS 433.97]